MSQVSSLRIITAAALITGNIIGAGILGLPITTGLAGFIPAMVAMVFTWALMLTTALILSGYVLKSGDEHFDLPALYAQTFGKFGRWLAVLANLLILYGLLVAYLSGAGSTIINLFKLPLPNFAIVIIFFILATGLTIFGLAIVERGNAILMVLMWLAFLSLIVIAFQSFQGDNLAFTNWPLLPGALPIMVTAFHFHNIIPTICRSLDSNPTAVRKAIVYGSLTGLAMNFLWVFTVLGDLPVTGSGEFSILYAFQNGQPATIPLSKLIGLSYFTQIGLLFALLAITTSYLANGTALMSFFSDMVRDQNGRPRWLVAVLLTFLPPLVVSLAYPALFLKALDVVGGVGISFLFGVLPGLLAFKAASTRTRRYLALLIVACFLLVLAYEIFQECGLLTIDPEVEIWKQNIRN